MHAGQESFRITTPAAVWVYHAEGAGLASLYDRDGKDWISYRQGGGSAGEFRGIPNLGVFGHPGYRGAKGAITTVEIVERERVRLRSVSRDGKWETVWEFLPQMAHVTVEKAGEPYWFLYEGTPNGALDLERGYWGMPDGVKRRMTETWSGDIDGSEWVYFGDESSRRVLFLVNHQDDRYADQFWQMQGKMTMWGFGREYRCCGRYLRDVPGRFSLGFAESNSFDSIRETVWAALQ